MLKKNKGLMILTSIIILLPMVVGILLWDQLPEKMAIHWGANGEADGWSSRPVAVFGMPLLLLAIHWLGVWLTGEDKRNRHQNEKVLQLMFWIAPVVSLFGMGSTYASALGQPLRIDRLALLLLGIVFAMIGNYMPKCKHNYSIGVKTPWTLNDEENWYKTHRFAGILWVAGGVLIMATSFLGIFWLFMIVLVPMAFAPMIYSYCIYRKKNC